VTGPDYEVRQGVREDAGAIAAMYQETWPLFWETGDGVCGQLDVLDAIGGQALIATRGGEVVGHCEFIPTREPPPYGCWGYLEALEVHRRFYRRGIGTALVREAVRRCAAFGCARFGTSPDDERSEGLYRKVGMVNVERRLVTKFELHGEIPEPDVDAVEGLPRNDRPWEEFLHVLGRLHCASYWWSRMFCEGEERSARAFADRVVGGAGAAVVFCNEGWLHVLLPPDRAADRALLQDAVAYGARRLRALGGDGFHTLMPLHLADAVRVVPGIYPSESHFDCHMWMPL